jgi:hypothetical protein
MLLVPAGAGEPVRTVRLPLLEYRARRRVRDLVGDPLATSTKVVGVQRDRFAVPHAFFSPHGHSDGRPCNIRASRLTRHSVWGDAIVLALLFDGWYGDSLVSLSPEMTQQLQVIAETEGVLA